MEWHLPVRSTARLSSVMRLWAPLSIRLLHPDLLSKKKYMLPGPPRMIIILCSALLGMSLLIPGNAASQNLKTGDGVRLTFYNIEDNVSGDYFVMQDWTLQLPYIGQMSVRDRGFDVLRDSIIVSYQNIYREPELTVQPLFRINILGEVRNSGIYYVTGFERLSDLLAMAGGETREADLDKIYLVRDDERIDINAKRILKEGSTLEDFGLRSGDQVYVSHGGLVSFRNASLLISGIGVAATVAAIFLTRN